jgi:hypothetical protein
MATDEPNFLSREVRIFWEWVQALPEEYIIQMKDGEIYAIPPEKKSKETDD